MWMVHVAGMRTLLDNPVVTHHIILAVLYYGPLRHKTNPFCTPCLEGEASQTPAARKQTAAAARMLYLF